MIKTQYRYERKFFVSDLDSKQIQLILKLHPAHFKEIYHQRQVNNIYLDTCNFSNYYANLEGHNNRLKIRVRWYEDLKKAIQPQLEFKIKTGLINKKSITFLESFTLNKSVPLFKIINPDSQDQELLTFKNLQAVMFNTYQRQYFQDFAGQYRITIDEKLNFYSISNNKKINWQNQIKIPGTILELKYNLGAENSADRISNFFPFRLSRSSKYVMGMQNLYPQIKK